MIQKSGEGHILHASRSLDLRPDSRTETLKGKGSNSTTVSNVITTTKLSEMLNWLKLETGGPCPSSRQGHSAVVIGSNMLLFGGIESHKVADYCRS